MIRWFLLPGDLVCDLIGLPENSDHRQLLRVFINITVWSAVAVAIVAAVMGRG